MRVGIVGFGVKSWFIAGKLRIKNDQWRKATYRQGLWKRFFDRGSGLSLRRRAISS
jgi:hypothetical protein